MSRTATPTPTVRCAIYTRKSTDENLDTDFNSLDAQREAGEAYIASQREQGWTALRDRYDDAACSGGTLDRPALQRLLRDIEAGRVDCVVTYKVDRLSRSLLDFAKLVEVFDRHSVTFIAVTQAFNTTTSMGRLTLNMLLSFAQFEREVIGERIRDKVAASKQRGMYMGGTPPLGYDVVDKKLVVNPAEAELVREIFTRFVQTAGATTRLAQALNAEGRTTKAWTTKDGTVRPGASWHKGHLYQMLNNRLYLGEITHKGNVYPGEHAAILPQELWDQAQAILAENSRVRAARTRATTPALLKGLIRCGHCGTAMGITYTKKAGTSHYRYYLCGHAAKAGYESCPVRTVPAGDIEAAVIALVQKSLTSPEVAARTYREARGLGADAADEAEITAHLRQFTDLWDELFPAEQARIVRLLVQAVTVTDGAVRVALRADGLHALLDEWRGAAVA